MTIGELARRAGVGVETVRYYQRRGIFPEPPRQHRGTREYSPEALDLLRFIRRARGLGFTIREVERLVALRKAKKDSKELVTLLQAKAQELEHKIRETQRMVRTLQDLADKPEGTDRWRLFDTAEGIPAVAET